jgi:predicted nuclease of predicted toxin-antitoxin system
MARIYANENFPLPVVEALRDAGHDVVTVAETGKAEQSWPDKDVLDFAVNDDRALLTLNRRHFIRLHSEESTTQA